MSLLGVIMNIRWFHRSALLGIVTLGLLTMGASARTKDGVKARTPKGGGEEVQRTPRSLFDQQNNIVSNLSFATTNYGIFGLDVAACGLADHRTSTSLAPALGSLR
jgi:hypothetical protein